MALKEKPKMIDERMDDHTGAVICDAGLVVCSLFPKAMKDGFVKEMDLASSDFLEMIELIKAAVAEICPETSSFNFPRTNQLGFIDFFLLENMKDLTNPEAGHQIAIANYPIQMIQEELAFLRSFLGKIMDLRNEDVELQALWERVVEVAYRVEFLIGSAIARDILDSSSMSFDSILQEMKIIKAEALEISVSKRLDAKAKEGTERLNHMPLQGSKPPVNDLVVGFKDEATSIVNRLTRGALHLQIISIVGMPGLGKTTLAKLTKSTMTLK